MPVSIPPLGKKKRENLPLEYLQKRYGHALVRLSMDPPSADKICVCLSLQKYLALRPRCKDVWRPRDGGLNVSRRLARDEHK